jgi:hypothetical protein
MSTSHLHSLPFSHLLQRPLLPILCLPFSDNASVEQRLQLYRQQPICMNDAVTLNDIARTDSWSSRKSNSFQYIAVVC